MIKSTARPGSSTRPTNPNTDADADGASVELEQGHPEKSAGRLPKNWHHDALREVGADGFNKMVADLVERG